MALLLSQSTDRLSAEVNRWQGTSQNPQQQPRTSSSSTSTDLLPYTCDIPQPASGFTSSFNTVHLDEAIISLLSCDIKHFSSTCLNHRLLLEAGIGLAAGATLHFHSSLSGLIRILSGANRFSQLEFQ